MKRKNSTAKRKVKKKLIIKNSKILNFYKEFKLTLFKLLKNKKFAIAVSGGSDSLSLAYFTQIYSNEFGNKINVLIVDHKLRKESTKEAIKVKNILKKKGITSTILTWENKIPKKNIQKNARDIRY